MKAQFRIYLAILISKPILKQTNQIVLVGNSLQFQTNRKPACTGSSMKSPIDVSKPYPYQSKTKIF